MQTRGAIYHHKDMVFYNGGVANKYLILLNTPDKADPYLFVKTTTKKKSRPSNPGCIKKHKCFFIKAGKAFFPNDSWVLLHEIYEIHPNKIDTDSNITILKDELKHEVIEGIVNCLFKVSGQDMPGSQKKLLRPPMQEHLIKLQAKFNQNR